MSVDPGEAVPGPEVLMVVPCVLGNRARRRMGRGAALVAWGMAAVLASGTVLSLAGCTHEGTSPVFAPGSDVPQPPRPAGTYAVVNGSPADVQAIPMGERAVVERIIQAALTDSKAIDHVRTISEEFGHRLTGSSASERGELWARDQFRSWGWKAELVQWGEVATRWDRGPQWARIVMKTPAARRMEQMRGDDRDATRGDKGIVVRTDPPEGYRVVRDMQFTTLSWTAGTEGPRQGPVVRMPRNEEEYEQVRASLKGAWILVPRVAVTETPGVDLRRGGGLRGRFDQRVDARKKLAEGAAANDLPWQQRMILDGAHGFISASVDERVWTSGATNWRTRPAADYPPDVEINIRLSDYDFISSRLTDGDPIEVEANLPVTIVPGPIPVYNVVAELTGTEKPDEVVVLCAHFDSWNGQGSQGTVDNATGSGVMMEAARLLSLAGARPKRSIRVILWTGEEQGLLGARGYVKSIEPEWSKISACFNDDGGTNWQGGVGCIDAMLPYLAAATAPINGRFYSKADGKFMDVNLRLQERFTQIAASDHYAFFEVGIPGFFWDETGRADYWYAWHTQNDRIDQAIPEYLAQSAACSAVVAYNLACAPELLPRWPRERGASESLPTDGRGPGQQPPVTRPDNSAEGRSGN